MRWPLSRRNLLAARSRLATHHRRRRNVFRGHADGSWMHRILGEFFEDMQTVLGYALFLVGPRRLGQWISLGQALGCGDCWAKPTSKP